MQRDGTGHSARKQSRRDSKERLRRLETQIRNMDDTIQSVILRALLYIDGLT